MVMRTCAMLAAIALPVLGGVSVTEAGVLHGEVFFRERIVLPSDAVLEVSLLDVTRRGGLGELIASVQMRPHRQVPIPFKIRYGDDDIEPRRSYAVRARILAGGRLIFVSARSQRVLTQASPAEVHMLMAQVSSLARAANFPTGHTWLAEEIKGSDVLDGVQSSIRVGEAGDVSGSAGCNTLRSTAQIDGQSLSFGVIATTRKLCAPAVMEQEGGFLHALDLTREFRIDGQRLRFLNGSGAVVLSLTRFGNHR